MINKRILIASLVLVLLATLVSCGQGRAAKPSAPTLNLDYQAVKVFNFSWTDVEGETGYKLFEDEDGSGNFVEAASIPADASSYQLEVFLPAKVNARYKLAACNEGGCSESAEVEVAVDQLVRAIGYFKASNTDAWDEFGRHMALSADGNTLAVGAEYESSNATGINGNQSDNSAKYSGAVYVFAHDATGRWVQQAYIKASNAETWDTFGEAVALSADGDTLVVGAPGEDSKAIGIGGDQSDNSLSGSGAVYVFVRDANDTWSQQAYIKASNPGQDDDFGTSAYLSQDGNVLAVGAPREDASATGGQNDNSATDSGAVYVFTRNAAGSWNQQAYIKASNAGAGDEFGNALSLAANGATLAVGAHLEDSNAAGVPGDNSAADSGAVYVFGRSSGVWSQRAYLKASNAGSGDEFGYSVALADDGNTLAVGASREDSNATGVNGDQNNNSSSDSGAAYIFTNRSGNWTQQAYIKASNTDTADRFGFSVDITRDGMKVVACSPEERSGATGINGIENDNSGGGGACYVFVSDGSTWKQQAYIKASNHSGYFGDWVAISGNGKTLAVSGSLERGGAKGIGGDLNDYSASASGAVYVY